MGGENLLHDRVSAAGGGSSPRGRGKPLTAILPRGTVGLIPAWAGKTVCPSNRVGESGAHPRVGGENGYRRCQAVGEVGSSPRGRGKRAAQRRLFRSAGLIPAWAGKTRHRRGSQILTPAHPRVGGENQNASRLSAAWSGSSPRGRGKRRRPDFRRAPALAHPRVGGENDSAFALVVPMVGSSPRGRGKRLNRAEHRANPGLIPAWAGKTARSMFSASGEWAHPRVGGENIKAAVSVVVEWGSSPRGRGKRGRPLQ